MKRIAVFFTMLAALLLAGPQMEAAPKAPKSTATFAIFIDNASYAACKAEVSLSLFPRGRGLVCLIDNWVLSFSQQSQWYYEVPPHTCQNDHS